jgi:hypothetical protein
LHKEISEMPLMFFPHRYQVSHPYKTTGTVVILYLLICKFVDTTQQIKGFCAEW